MRYQLILVTLKSFQSVRRQYFYSGNVAIAKRKCWRLRRVASNRTEYQRRYKHLCEKQQRQRLRYRLQHHQTQVFRELEAQWAAICSRKTV